MRLASKYRGDASRKLKRGGKAFEKHRNDKKNEIKSVLLSRHEKIRALYVRKKFGVIAR